jgi:CRISPR system Cascade subunit CasA
MKTACFNLVDEPWLPVTLEEDFPRRADRGPLPRVSLREAFEHGDKIVDLRCYAHERIALMRLLICIAQRALNGPADEEGWKSCRGRVAHQAVAYLEEQRDCFNLFGDGPRFLQAKDDRERTVFSTQKFRFIDEEGTTLFDAHVQPGSHLSSKELAIGLVTFQSFAAGGRVEGSAKSLPAGLCREASALHAFLLGDNLLESIWLNLVPKNQIAESRDMVFGEVSWHAGREGANSYLYRLAPIARHLWLIEDGASVEGRGGWDGFLTFEKHGTRELTASVRTVNQTRQRDRSGVEELVSATAGGGVPKAAWRELHALAVLRSAKHRGGPVALQHCGTLQAAGSRTELHLWCGALVGGGKGRAAGVGDIIESTFRLPIQFLEDADIALGDDPRKCLGPNLTYRKGVGYADEWAGRLQKAVYTYHAKLADTERGKKARTQAAMRYWTALEQRAEAVLLHDVAIQSDKYDSNEKHWMAKTPWGREVWHAVHDAYEFTCPHSTPRQLRAYAAGLAVLRREDRVKSAAAGEKEDKNGSTEGGEL